MRPYSANVRDRPSSAKPAPPTHFDFESSDDEVPQALKKEFSSSEEESPLVIPPDSESSPTEDESPYFAAGKHDSDTESEESYNQQISQLPSMGRGGKDHAEKSPKEPEFVKEWKPKTPPSIQIEDADDRRIPERPSDKKPIDRPQSKYQRPSDTKQPSEQLPERPTSVRPSDKKQHERVAKVETPEAVSESEENYEDDYLEDFDDEVDEYIKDVDEDDYNSDFDNPALLANRIEKPEFLTGKGNYESS